MAYADISLEDELEERRIAKLREEKHLCDKFKSTLQELPSFKTSYGDIVSLYKVPLERQVIGESKEAINRALGKPVADFEEEVPARAKPVLEHALHLYPHSAYFLKENECGTNMMEIRPWSGGYRYGIELVHVPYNFIPVNRHFHPLASTEEYENLMRTASIAEHYETKPKIVVKASMDGHVREDIEKIFELEWKDIARPGEETPAKYQFLLDRLDPYFRFESQPLYARRYNHGMCIAVHREWSSKPATMSLVLEYIPDAFRFGTQTRNTASSIAGLMVQRGMVSTQVMEDFIKLLKGEL